MFIQYNDTNVHAFGYLNTNTLNGNQSPQDVQWLRPGWNEFPKRVWEQNKEHPQVKKMIAKRKIVIMNEKVTFMKNGKKMTKIVGQTDEEVRLKWFDETRAIEIVKHTFNRDLLQRWIDEETRHKVKKKLEKQLEPLLASPEKDDEDDEDSED